MDNRVGNAILIRPKPTANLILTLWWVKPIRVPCTYQQGDWDRGWGLRYGQSRATERERRYLKEPRLQPLRLLSWVTNSSKVQSGSTPTLEPHTITGVNLQAINTSWTVMFPYAGPLLRLWPWLSIDLQKRVATWRAQCQGVLFVSCFNVSYVIITWVLW